MFDLAKLSLRKILQSHTFESHTNLLSMTITVEANDEEERVLNKAVNVKANSRISKGALSTSNTPSKCDFVRHITTIVLSYSPSQDS